METQTKQKETREQVYARLSAQYRAKWVREVLEEVKSNLPVHGFTWKYLKGVIEDIKETAPEKPQFTNIDAGLDITDYSNASGDGEVIVKPI